MGNLKLALIIKSPRDDVKFLLEKQKQPAKFGDEDYDSFVDSDLWDLPSTDLLALEDGVRSGFTITILESCSEEVDLMNFDFESTLILLLANLGIDFSDVGEWRFVRFVEEPEFGPDSRVRTCFISGKLLNTDQSLQDSYKWMSMEACLDSLIDVKRGSDRVGPLVLLGLGDDSRQSLKHKLSSSLSIQEYPPGVMLVPMRSRTLKPFKTTNLVVFAPENGSGDHQGTDFVAHGDALIVDPGCLFKLHVELKKIVDALPRKLIVFVTHHHRDHTDGLSAIQESNPDAILVAHVKTRHRIDGWSGNYIPVSGGENIYVNGQRLTVIFAPGHTDGHMALLHISTQSLIVGDHCVGQGSTFLDIKGGGNMTEYFQSTYKFLELSPNVVIPMHGRVNLWPKHMLCGYLKNRRSREESILKATEDGAHTLYDIVANVYSSVDRRFWWAAASNVRLHIDKLAVDNKLPEGFSIQKFKASCGLRFAIRWTVGYIRSKIPFKINKPGFIMSVIAAGAGYFLLYTSKKKNQIKS
ncbi:Metallo-beta-lactamase [Arabidopsis thaliana x Arabidopsis arenosa]|uniref:Metallo-beta-lactamase n=1 Tax=Arabidopsis thaliana x Arabidopsis arenosa TaxID=1240361 RepID=A0A8T2CCC7_9BRAS|nr:Metallo-beta-lactamase [Arabidopsis thaliana x Arabidopsis arenosa]